MNSIKIEIAGEQDSEVIREIYQTAFPEKESAMVAKLAVDLLAEKTVPEILSLVAQEIETTIGHVAFSPVEIENNEHYKASILAPLGSSSRASTKESRFETDRIRDRKVKRGRRQYRLGLWRPGVLWKVRI